MAGVCPLTEEKLTQTNCSNSKCMYNKRSFKSHCANAAVSILKSQGLSKVELKTRVADLYGVDLEEAELAIKRVVSLLCLSEYFMYVFGKTLIDAKPKELADVRGNQLRYDAWRSGSKKVSFATLVVSVAFVSNNLK